MGLRFSLFLAFAVLVPLAGATPLQLEEETCGSPPCGWILPILDIQIEGKMPCGGGQIIYAQGPPEDCFEILQPGESRTYPGVLQLKWEVSEEGTYPKEIGTDIVITFSGTANNAPWLALDVTGEEMVDGEYRLDDAALVDPANMRTVTNAAGQETVWFWFERNIDITFTRIADPDAESIKAIETREGVLAFFVKTRSTESGPRFKEGFGIEEFRFNTCTDPEIARQVEPCPQPASSGATQDAPGLGWPLLVGALGAIVMLRRR